MKTEREKMTNAEPFLTTDPQLMEDKKNARLLCSRFNHSPEDEALRKSLLKELLGGCGEEIAVKPPNRRFIATTATTFLWARTFS